MKGLKKLSSKPYRTEWKDQQPEIRIHNGMQTYSRRREAAFCFHGWMSTVHSTSTNVTMNGTVLQNEKYIF